MKKGPRNSAGTLEQDRKRSEQVIRESTSDVLDPGCLDVSQPQSLHPSRLTSVFSQRGHARQVWRGGKCHVFRPRSTLPGKLQFAGLVPTLQEQNIDRVWRGDNLHLGAGLEPLEHRTDAWWVPAHGVIAVANTGGRHLRISRACSTHLWG